MHAESEDRIGEARGGQQTRVRTGGDTPQVPVWPPETRRWLPGNPVRFPLSHQILMSVPIEFPPVELTGGFWARIGQVRRGSDDLHYEGEASRFRWLRALATTEIDPRGKRQIGGLISLAWSPRG